ncbi:hypothetical protein AAF712_004763 [Marasmius tenuissimus]|uniref:CsbD-like domain-containing protein n=1 Tax=Marasmius tenuissimus TaxID=585030 RepID=A0ABR3A538_9AGAR
MSPSNTFSNTTASNTTPNTFSGEPSKRSGQLHSAKGDVKETVGGMVGAHGMQQRGQEEHARGKAEYDAARTQGLAQGTQNQVGGKKDSVVGAVTGDRTQQAAGKQEHGHMQQNMNRHV